MYRKFVEERCGHDDKKPLAKTIGAAFLGSDTFILRVMNANPSEQQRGSSMLSSVIPGYNPSNEQIIATVDASFGADSSLARKTAIYLCHKLSGNALREIGACFGLGESGISQASRRYTNSLGVDHFLERKLSVLKNELLSLPCQGRGGGTKGREKGGGSPSQPGVKLLEMKISEVLMGFPQILFATLFGSAAKGRMTEQSDVDIAVASWERLTVEIRDGLAVALSCALDREGDLVDFRWFRALAWSRLFARGQS